MAHCRGKPTPFGRLLLVQRVEHWGWPVPQAEEAVGSLGPRRTSGCDAIARREGRAGGQPLPSEALPPCPARGRGAPDPPGPPPSQARATPLGPCASPAPLDYLRGVRRHGLSRLRDLDRPSGVPVRYVREHPGEPLHLDAKKLGRIPPGGGHHILGREEGRKGRP